MFTKQIDFYSFYSNYGTPEGKGTLWISGNSYSSDGVTLVYIPRISNGSETGSQQFCVS